MGKLYYQDKAGDIKVTSKGIPSPTDETAVAEALNEQSATLFKTINGQTITGEGNIEVGGGSVIANPEMEGDEPDLTGIEIDGNKYKIPEGGESSGKLLETDKVLYLTYNDTTIFELVDINDDIPGSFEELVTIVAKYEQFNQCITLCVDNEDNILTITSFIYAYEINNTIAIELHTSYGRIDVIASDDEGTLVYNVDWTNFTFPSEGGGNVGSPIANAVIRLQETTNNFVIQTPDGVLSDLDNIWDFLDDNMDYLLIVSVVDSNNMPAAMLAPFMYDEIEDGIALLLATPYGSINVDIVRPQSTTNFYVDWSQYSKGSNINTTCSYYVENSTKRAVPVVKFIDCLSDTHNPRIYNADEFYALVQEAYAENNDEHHEFNLPTYFILNSAQPINLNAIRELTGQEGVWIQLFSEDDDPTGQSSITYSTEGYTSASENYIRVTDFGGAEGIVIVFYYGGE